MSLYLSYSQNFCFPLRDSKVHYLADGPFKGEVERVEPAITAQFQRATSELPEYAKKAVSSLPGFGKGRGHDWEESPFAKVGMYDTDVAAIQNDWSLEIKEWVESRMDGAVGVYFVRIDVPRLPAPWPNYSQLVGDDEDTAEKIARKVVEDGYSPAAVIAYERENENRKTVIDVLEVLTQDEVGLEGQTIQA